MNSYNYICLACRREFLMYMEWRDHSEICIGDKTGVNNELEK